MIKDDTLEYPSDRFERFRDFHDVMLDEYSQSLSGDSHIILKMYHFWEYFAQAFSDTHKTLKKVKKAKSLDAYQDAVTALLDNEQEVAMAKVGA